MNSPGRKAGPFALSGCRELNPGHYHPKVAYYRYTTPRKIPRPPLQTPSLLQNCFAISETTEYLVSGAGKARLFFHHGGFFEIYFRLERDLIHLVQASTLLPEANLTHCKFGYFLFLVVGLYFPRSFFNFQTKIDFLPQIVHCFAIII